MKYIEHEKKQPIDWYAELTADKIDWEKLGDLSGDWVTCACGNQCDIIPRDWIGEPIDDELSSLGYKFNDAVCDRLSESAIQILHRIEIRSQELIDRIHKRDA